MAVESKTDKAIEKIVKLHLMGVADREIAAAIGVDASRISQVKNSARFKEKLAELAAEQLEEQEMLNSGWDSVEQLALSHIIEALQHDPDPEFALRTASVANKARRRGHGFGNSPALAHGAGGRAVINLQAVFVNKLQTGNIEDSLDDFRNAAAISGNETDMMSVEAVEKLLQITDADTGRLAQIEKSIPDFDEQFAKEFGDDEF